jgi:hypothetical protein
MSAVVIEELGGPEVMEARNGVLLARLVRHLSPDQCRSEADVERSLIAEVVARLRAESKVVLCGKSDWTIAATE